MTKLCGDIRRGLRSGRRTSRFRSGSRQRRRGLACACSRRQSRHGAGTSGSSGRHRGSAQCSDAFQRAAGGLVRRSVDGAKPGDRGRLAHVRRIQVKGTEGLLPDHLPFKPVLPELDEHRRVRPFIGPRIGLHLGRLQPGEFQATTIFPPDQRYLFDDTSFPWCTTGRVDLSGGWGAASWSARVTCCAPRI